MTISVNTLFQGGPVLRVMGSLPLECIQEADGSILIRSKLQPVQATLEDRSNLNTIQAVIEASSKALTTSSNAEPQSTRTIINAEQPEPKPSQSTAPIMSNTMVTATVPSSGLTYSSRNEVTKDTNGSVEPQSIIFSGQPPEPSIARTPIQQIQTPPIPVPRARTLPRDHTSNSEAATFTEAISTKLNPVEVFPLSVSEQSSSMPMTIPRSNTVGQLGFATSDIHTSESGAAITTADLHKPKRSQTLPRRPPTAKRNLPEKDCGGPTNELQALLAKRRQWEQNDAK